MPKTKQTSTDIDELLGLTNEDPTSDSNLDMLEGLLADTDDLDDTDLNGVTVNDLDDADLDDTVNDLDLSSLDDLDSVDAELTDTISKRGKRAPKEPLTTAKPKRLTSRTLKSQMDKVLTLTPKQMAYQAIEFNQGNRLLYLVAVPFRDLQYLNCFDSENLPPEMRSQREITPSRAIAIANYLIDRKEKGQPYIFNAVTIGIDTSMTESSFAYDNGVLNIPPDAFLSIYDGQHRITGTILAYAGNPEQFIDDYLPVIFTSYTSIEEAQQLFSDINANSAKVNKSLTKLYDHTDTEAEIIRKLLHGVPFLRNHVDKEKTTVSPKGSNIFTIISLGNFVSNMFSGIDASQVSMIDKVELASRYWNLLISGISELKQVNDKNLSVTALRTDTVFSATATIEALGMVFNTIYTKDPANWEKSVKALNFNNVDWYKLADHWQGVLFINGRLNKSKATIAAMAEFIVKHAA